MSSLQDFIGGFTERAVGNLLQKETVKQLIWVLDIDWVI
jgi:hypothetical protein